LFDQDRLRPGVGEDKKTGAALGLSSTEIDQLSGLTRGEGLWRIGERSFVFATSARPVSWHSSTPIREWKIL